MKLPSVLAIGVASCALLLSACSSDGGGLSVGAGSGGVGASTPSGGSGSGSSGSSGSGSSGSGSTGSTSTGGSGTTASNNPPLGNGTVTVTAGGTTISTPSTPATTTLASDANGLVSPIVSTGNALLPTGSANSSLVPATAKVSGATLNGSSTQPLGVGVLSATPANGTLASANALTAGKTATVTVDPAGASSVTNGVAIPATTTLAGQTLTGGSAKQPLAVNALSSTPAAGSVATANVLSNGQTGVTATTPSALTNTAGGAVGSVLNGSSSLANATAANQAIITGANPLVGASVVSPTQNAGSLATVGAASNNQPVTVKLGRQ
ncbi:MAG TPA: hypothetical protein VIM56_13630 [Rhizomicrobium sp.]